MKKLCEMYHFITILDFYCLVLIFVCCIYTSHSCKLQMEIHENFTSQIIISTMMVTILILFCCQWHCSFSRNILAIYIYICMCIHTYTHTHCNYCYDLKINRLFQIWLFKRLYVLLF